MPSPKKPKSEFSGFLESTLAEIGAKSDTFERGHDSDLFDFRIPNGPSNRIRKLKSIRYHIQQTWSKDFEAFCRDCIKIKNRYGRGVIPFRFYRLQKRFWELEKEAIAANRAFNLQVLKIRQAGSSTYFAIRILWKVLFNKNTSALIMAHDDDLAASLFGILKFAKDRLPEPLRPLTRLDNRGILYFANPDPDGDPGIESKIIVESAKNKNAGAGFTLHHCHIAEGGRFDKLTDVKVLMTSLFQAVPDHPSCSMVDESTAHGEGSFKERWEQESGTLKEFISYPAVDDYRAEALAMAPVIDVCGIEDSLYGNEEHEAELIRKEVRHWIPEAEDINTEVLKWLSWRRKRITDKCGGDKKVFDQEYPISPERAFMMSGDSVFDTEKLYQIATELKNAPPKCDRYRFDTSYDTNEALKSEVLKREPSKMFAGAFEATPYGHLFIYEHPVKGGQYAIGVDTSEGLTDGDESSLVIARVFPTYEEVAHFCKPIDPDLFGDACYILGRYFNDALVGIEMNAHGHTTLSRILRDLKYPTSRIFRHKTMDRTKIDIVNRYGWNTNMETKRKMIDYLKMYIRDDAWTFNHLPSVLEHKNYKRFDEGKYFSVGPKGEKKSANRVIATAICLQMCLSYPHYVQSVSAERPEKNSVFDWGQRYGWGSNPTRHW